MKIIYQKCFLEKNVSVHESNILYLYNILNVINLITYQHTITCLFILTLQKIFSFSLQLVPTKSTMVARNLFTVNRTLTTVKQSSKYASVVIRKHSVWTQDRVIKSPFKDVHIPNCTLYEYIWQNLDKWPERTVSVSIYLLLICF